MMQDFLASFTGQRIERPLAERAEVLNYALGRESGRNKYFFSQVQEFINLGWLVDYNDEGEPIKVYQPHHSDDLSELIDESNEPNHSTELTSPVPTEVNKPSLIERAQKLNEALKIECVRQSKHFLNQVAEFMRLGWMVDFDSAGYPLEVYQF